MIVSKTSLFVALGAAATSFANAAGTGGNIRGATLAEDTTCLSIGSESDCNSNQSCTWCRSKAVPSECLTLEQSAMVPGGVFECAAKARSYNLKQGVTHTLTDQTVEGGFCDANSPKSLSGYMDVSGSQYDQKDEDKHLFFWFFEKRATSLLPTDEGSNPWLEAESQDENEIPLIVWLTGGPGCSSSLALLTENGPCSPTKPHGDSTETNPYSWTETAHVLWLDQPAGVGYSYGKATDKNEKMVGEDAYYFLQAFYKSHPEYVSNPLFIVGESYGGHYAPAIAHRVWKGNKNLGEGLEHINLKGVAIGNGLTDPEEQYKWYAEMAYKNGHGIKAINEETYNTMKALEPKCTKLIQKCNEGDNFMDNFACQGAFTVCNAGLTSPYRASGLNPYDITKECGNNPLCYDFSHVEAFLNSEDTRSALHVSEHAPKKWVSCNMGVNMKFHTDWMKDFSPYVADLLNDDIPVLIYAGDVDFICNYMGNRAWTLNLEWKHKDEFNAAKEHEWNKAADTDEKGVGLARTSNGFTFLQVYDAGHMVPTDQPKVALDMIKNFVKGGTF